MKPTTPLTVCLLLVAATMTGTPSFAATTGDLLQKGLYAEEVEGNIDSAVTFYDQIIRDGAAPPSHVAQALYRQGLCYLKLKNEAAARAALEKLVAEFPGQADLVLKARPMLEELTDLDPAALMPPGTLLYVEFGAPGKQINTALNVVKGTPFENPLAAISGNATQGGGKSPGDMVGALLNPAMLAEFKKIRSSAIGITGISGNHPGMIGVLCPGKSDALRGLMVAGLGMAGAPGEPIEGMQQIRLPEDMAVAHDDKVILFARPASELSSTVRRYKGRSIEPTLVAGKAFANLKRAQREQNALTVWANVDEAFPEVLKMFVPPGKIPAELAKANALLDFAHIDELVLAESFETNGVRLNAGVELKEDNHCVGYQMIRTAKIGKAALEAVPAEAIALASFSLNQPDPAQAGLLRAQIQSATKTDLADELFTNVIQITLFLMPAGPETTANEDLQNRLGVAIASRNPAQTRRMLATVVGNLTGTPPNPNASQFNLGPITLHLAQAGSTTTLALSQDAVDASMKALKNHQSACVTGPLSGAINDFVPDANKAILVNVGGVLRLLGPQMAPPGFNEQQLARFRTCLAQLARAVDATTVSWRTIERPTHFEVNAALTGIPPVTALIAPVTEIARLGNEAAAAEKAKRITLARPALIAQAPTPPALDGKSDEAWSAARSYNLGNVLYAPPASADDLSANYRALWDADNLYVRVDVTDNVLRHDSPADNWYESDSVEVYIDADNGKASAYGQNDYQYAFNWDKTTPTLQESKHSRTNGIQYALVTTGKGYRLEAKFPWTTLGVKPSPGAKVGLDVHVNDSDGGGKRKSKLAWHDPHDGAWNNPEQFGTAELAGLVGWWKFDETEGTSAADSSGGNHTGTLVGHAKWAPGRIGGAIELDGAGSFVRIADKAAFNFGAEATIAAWVRFRSVPGEWTAIVAKGDTAWRLSTVRQEKLLHFAVGSGADSGNPPYVDGAQPVNESQWHHVAGVYDGKTVNLYVDGKLDRSTPWSEGVGQNDVEVLIGENAEQTQRCFDGWIDDVRVYNCALPDREIMALAAGK